MNRTALSATCLATLLASVGASHAAPANMSVEQIIEQLAMWAGVPVYNGLSDEWHPTQVLADFLTLREHVAKPLGEMTLCYVGDARSSMADSYMVGCALLGIDLRVASPSPLWPDPVLLEYVQALAAGTEGRLTITENLEVAALGVDAIVTEAWVSRSEPVTTWGERIALLRPYQVDSRAMAMTHNPDVRFLHRLPSFRAADTVVGREIFDRYGLTELEVTDEVFESSASVVFDEAENRLHTIKAVMVATLTS